MRGKETETILIVDDERLVLGLIKQFLSPSGYRLLLASSGKEALEKARKTNEKIDLLLTDVTMPGMTGLELARQFIKEYPTTKIIIMSGNIDTSIICQDHLLCEKAFLEKPFKFGTLMNMIRSVLKS